MRSIQSIAKPQCTKKTIAKLITPGRLFGLTSAAAQNKGRYDNFKSDYFFSV